MKLAAVDTYRCPVTGAELELESLEQLEVELDADVRSRAAATGLEFPERREDVKTGLLVNRTDGYWYPIIEHVPVLLDYDNPAYEILLVQTRLLGRRTIALRSQHKKRLRLHPESARDLLGRDEVVPATLTVIARDRHGRRTRVQRDLQLAP